MGGSADYGPKSISRVEGISFKDGHVGKMPSPIMVRNLKFFLLCSTNTENDQQPIWRTLGGVRAKSTCCTRDF